MAGLVTATPRPIGPDLPVAPLAYGCWRLTTADTGEARTLIETALDNGIDLVDTADVYGLDFGGPGFGGAEERLGAVLAEAPQLRDRMVLATKGGIDPDVPYDTSTTYLRSACEASLRRLGVETIDLYQLHRHDLFTHPADVAATLSDLRAEGKIREVGVSNTTPAQVRSLLAHLPFPLATLQPELSAIHLDALTDGTLDLAMEVGLTVLAYSPLGGGRILVPVPGPIDGPVPELLATLDRLAEREGVDRAAIALAFVLAHPSDPVAIIGSQDPNRIVASTAALGVHLDRTDVYDIIEASTGLPLP
jgi:aryl-alcohol dehydrogenase-like predicted oxidoreductase